VSGEVSMKYKSRPEAYIKCLQVLEMIHRCESDETLKDRVKEAIHDIRVCVENHEQDANKVVQVIKNLKQHNVENAGGKGVTKVLTRVLEALKESDYVQLPEEKWENPFGRRFESELQKELLFKPTRKMMQAVSKMTQKILAYFVSEELCEYLIDTLYYDGSYERDAISFGCFSGRPSKEQVVKMLNDNNPENLVNIMFIHFRFSQYIVRETRRYFDSDAEIHGSNIEDLDFYIEDCINEIYDTDKYYQDRGRGKELDEDCFAGEMGVLTDTCDPVFHEGLQLINEESDEDRYWKADSRCQFPDFNSKYACSLIENDTPYVAGPSGMTSCFIGLMMGLTDKKQGFDDNTRREYLAAVTAYIVSGGFHSLHEVLGPIRFQLKEENIMPESYEAKIAVEGELGSPANYHEFYKMMMDIDPEFSAVRERGYANLDKFLNNNFSEKMHEMYLAKVMNRNFSQKMHETCQDEFMNKNLSGKLRETYQRVIKLVDVFKDGVDEYIALKRKSQPSLRLMPGVNHGLKQASNYKNILQHANLYEKVVVMYAMFRSIKGGVFRDAVCDTVDRRVGLGGVANNILEKLSQTTSKSIRPADKLKIELKFLVENLFGSEKLNLIENLVDDKFLVRIDSDDLKAKDYFKSRENPGVFAQVFEDMNDIVKESEDKENIMGSSNMKR
jgi:hypothetical protein